MRPSLRLLPVLPALLVALAAPGPGHPVRAQEVQIDTPAFEYDKVRQVYRYTDARIRLGTLQIDAARIEIDPASGRIVAEGGVRLRDETFVGRAERLELDGRTGTGSLFGGDLYDGNTGFFLSGAEIRRVGPGRFIATDCGITTCRPKGTGWLLRAGEMDFRSGSFATATNVSLWAGGVPVYWTPFVAWPTVEERQSGFLAPRLVYQSSGQDRFDLDNRFYLPYFWALGPDHDLTLFPEHIERRGAALGAEYAYAFVERQEGRLRLWGLRETVGRDPAAENDILAPGEAEGRGRHPARYIAEWNHNQALGQRSRVVWSATRGSDGQVWREYEEEERYRPYFVFLGTWSHQAPWGDLAATLAQAGEFRFESVYADGYSFSDTDQRPQVWPRLRYAAAGQPLGSPVLGLRLDSTAQQFVTAEGVSGRVVTASPTLSLPWRIAGSLELRPTFARHFVEYGDLRRTFADRPGESLPAQGYAQDEAEVELRWPLARVYGEDGGALKHWLVPGLSYREVQDVPQPLAGSLVQGQLPGPTDDPVAAVVPSRFAEKLWTLRLDNEWWRRGPPTQGARLAGRLNLIQRYDVLQADEDFTPEGPARPSPQETDPGEPLLPAIVEGSLAGDGFTLNGRMRYHHQLNRMVESTVQVVGNASPSSTLKVTYNDNQFTYRTADNKLRPAGTTFAFDGQVFAGDALSLGLQGTLNLAGKPVPEDRRLEEAVVFADFHPGCYAVRLSYREALKLTEQQGAPLYYVEQRVELTFDLGGLVSGSRRVTTGVGP